MITDRDIREALVRKGWIVPETEEEVRWSQESARDSSSDISGDPESLQKLLNRFEAEFDDRSGSTSAFRNGPVSQNDLAKTTTEEENHGHTLTGLAKQKTGYRPTRIAASINATVELIDYINDFPEAVPEAVQSQVLNSFNEKFGISRAATRHAMMNNRPCQQAAASRDEAYSHSVPTFEKMLEASNLSGEQVEYWTKVAEGPQA